MTEQQQLDGTSAEWWDARYSESERIWSGRPNPVLVRETADLTPGRVLDLGCGEGADAVWLAEQGWRVTAVDISRVALERAAEHAAAAGAEVAARITWQRRDIAAAFPEGEFDLVSAQFLHAYGEFPRERILRSAAAAVAPGGVLLIESHAGVSPWEEDAHPELSFPTPEEIVAALGLAPGDWELLLAEEHDRTQTAPDGRPALRRDSTVKLRRLG